MMYVMSVDTLSREERMSGEGKVKLIELLCLMSKLSTICFFRLFGNIEHY